MLLPCNAMLLHKNNKLSGLKILRLSEESKGPNSSNKAIEGTRDYSKTNCRHNCKLLRCVGWYANQREEHYNEI